MLWRPKEQTEQDSTVAIEISQEEDADIELHQALEKWSLGTLPKSWLDDSDDPNGGIHNMLADYENLEATLNTRSITPRFRIRAPEHGAGFYAIQRPGPTERDDEFFNEERVYMTQSKPNGENEYRLIPIKNIGQWEEEGWRLCDAPEPAVDDDGRDRRECQRSVDVDEFDKPHKDFEKYWANEANIIESHMPHWEPGKPLDENYDEEDNISTAKQFRPQSEWKRVVTASSGSHMPYPSRPAGVGVGWGDYDMFHQWQNHGRKVTVDMLEEKPWSKEIEDVVMEFDDPTLNFTAPAIEGMRAQGAYDAGEEPQTLLEKLTQSNVARHENSSRTSSATENRASKKQKNEPVRGEF